MERRNFWRSPVALVGGTLLVVVGIVVLMSTDVDAPESSPVTGTGSTAAGRPPPTIVVSPEQQALLDAGEPAVDLTASGLTHGGRIAYDGWFVDDAYLCAEVLEAEALTRLDVLVDRYEGGGRSLEVSYVAVGNGDILEHRVEGYRHPRERCDWDDAYNDAIEPFDVPLPGDPEVFGFTSGESGEWVVASGNGRAAIVSSSGLDVDTIEQVALALSNDGPLATEPGGAAATAVP